MICLKQPEYKEFIENTENKSKTINYNLFEEYFNVATPTFLAKQLFKIKYKKENNELVNVIKSGLIDLKEEILRMSVDEKKFEKPNEIVNIIE